MEIRKSTPADVDALIEIGRRGHAASENARYAFDEHWFIAGSYTHLQFFARDNTGKSHLADPDIELTTRRPDGGGRYTQWVGILNANVLYTY